MYYSTSLYWSNEDEGYIALSPEFPGTSAFGETQAEALQEFSTALECSIETLRDAKSPLPEPRILHEYSGNIRLRVPKALHQHLAMQAEYEGISLNSLVMAALAEWIGAQKFETRIRKLAFQFVTDILQNGNISIRNTTSLRWEENINIQIVQSKNVHSQKSQEIAYEVRS